MILSSSVIGLKILFSETLTPFLNLHIKYFDFLWKLRKQTKPQNLSVHSKNQNDSIIKTRRMGARTNVTKHSTHTLSHTF